MIEIIFEDNHQLVLNKPGGLLTQPSGTEQTSLEALAKQWLKEKYQKPGNVFLEAVHRIDKPVSGLVLFAKTSKGLARLQAHLRSDRTEKHYLAFVEGFLKEKQALVEHFLLHDDFKASICKKNTPGAKRAVLEYKVIEEGKAGSLVDIKLHTGRYHQIRVQMATLGHSIWGDTKYGSDHRLELPLDPRRQVIALHHAEFSIPHPITEEEQRFQAPLPDYFHQLLRS